MTDNPDETLPVELLPCPFCGGEAYIEPNSSGLVGEDWPRIRCHQCDAKGPVSDVMNDTKPAIAAWNRRAAQSPPVNERWSLQFSNTPPSVTIWTAPLGHEPRTHSVAYIEFSSKAEKVFLAPAFRAIVSAHNAALDVAQSPPPVVSEGVVEASPNLITQIARLLAADPVCGGRVASGTIEAIAGICSRGCDLETVEGVRDHAVRLHEALGRQANSPWGLDGDECDLRDVLERYFAAIRNLGKETREG